MATIVTFTPISAQQPIFVTPFNEMLAAVNMVRTAAGWSAVTWSSIIGSFQPLPEPGKAIMATHVTTCRKRMDEALQALGVRTKPYLQPDLSGRFIEAGHVQEVQGRTQ